MPRSHHDRRTYAHDPADVRLAVPRVMGELGLRLRPGAGEWEVQASRPISMVTWGERITVTSATNPGGGTQVIVESRLSFGLVDWGRNRRNVDEILDALDAWFGVDRSPPPGGPANG